MVSLRIRKIKWIIIYFFKKNRNIPKFYSWMIHFLVLLFQSFLQYRVKITLSLTSIYLESPDALCGGIMYKMKLRREWWACPKCRIQWDRAWPGPGPVPTDTHRVTFRPLGPLLCVSRGVLHSLNWLPPFLSKVAFCGWKGQGMWRRAVFAPGLSLRKFYLTFLSLSLII